MKRVLLMATNPKDGTSLWRALGPFGHMQTQMAGEVLFDTMEGEVSWNKYSMYSALFMQRPYNENHLKMAQMARDMGKKIWVEYDDNLMEVPFSNPAYKAFSEPKIRQNISKIVTMADVVTVSTGHLKKLFEVINSNTIVIPNAMDDTILQPMKPDKKRNKLIAWRGSRTHDKDLIEYLKPMVQLAKDHPAWKWVFIGEPYFEVQSCMPPDRTLILQSIPFPRYFHFLNDFNAEIALVPLDDSKFNRSKSNIAYQEFVYSGAVPVVPDWEEWQLPGCEKYKTQAEFYVAVSKLINNADYRETLRLEGKNHFQNNMVLSKVNHMRIDLLRALIN